LTKFMCCTKSHTYLKVYSISIIVLPRYRKFYVMCHGVVYHDISNVMTYNHYTETDTICMMRSQKQYTCKSLLGIFKQEN